MTTLKNEIILKKASLEDSEHLQYIGRQTFLETFEAFNTAENMNSYLSQSFSLLKITEELEHPDSIFYLAWDKTQLAGYLKINFGQAQTELRENEGMEIERIYVLKAYQGKHVGQLLFEKAYEHARAASVRYIWLGVWENNPRAIHFYKKNGFTEFGKHNFIVGNDIQTDIMMKREIY